MVLSVLEVPLSYVNNVAFRDKNAPLLLFSCMFGASPVGSFVAGLTCKVLTWLLHFFPPANCCKSHEVLLVPAIAS